MNPITRSAIGVHHTGTSDAEWDGPANKRRVRSPEEAGYFRRIFAWRDAERDGDRKDHYRFIHHFVSEDGAPGAASTRGCSAGIGVLNGGRGGTNIPDADRQGVYNHLAAHLRDADQEPPELRSIMSVDEFRKAAADGETPKPTALQKDYFAKVEASEQHKGLYEFTISTGGIDRDGDRLAPDGWEFANYMRNPVVLWAHNYRGMPIGKALDVFVADGNVRALVEFTPAGHGPVPGQPSGDQVRLYYETGFLRAVSVGFLPLKWAFSEEEERRSGIDFEKQELLEFSAVTVPANADALMALAKGLPQPDETVAEALRLLFNKQFPSDVSRGPAARLALRRRRLQLER